MADDSILALFLKVQGGEASAAEVELLTGKLGELDKEVNEGQANLQGKFSQKFEHIALRGFLADGARSIGIGGELRPVLSAVQMGLVGVSEAMGPWLLGLVAVSALLFKVIEHSKKHSEGLDEALQKYKETTAAIDEYVSAGGRLTEALTAVADQEKKATAEVVKSITANNQAKLVEDQHTLTVNKNTEAYLKRSAARNNDTLGLVEAAKNTQNASNAIANDTADLEANAKGYANHADMVKGETETLKKHTEEVKKAAAESDKLAKQKKAEQDQELKAFDQLNAAGRQELDKQHQYANEEKELTTDTAAKKIAEITAWADKEKATSEKHYQDMLTALSKYEVNTDQLTAAHAATRVQIDKLAQDKINFALSQMPGHAQYYYKEMEDVARNSAKSIEAGFGQAFAKTLVEGASLSSGLKQMSKDIAEQIIADLIKVQIEALITKSILGPLGLIV